MPKYRAGDDEHAVRNNVLSYSCSVAETKCTQDLYDASHACQDSHNWHQIRGTCFICQQTQRRLLIDRLPPRQLGTHAAYVANSMAEINNGNERLALTVQLAEREYRQQ